MTYIEEDGADAVPRIVPVRIRLAPLQSPAPHSRLLLFFEGNLGPCHSATQTLGVLIWVDQDPMRGPQLNREGVGKAKPATQCACVVMDWGLGTGDWGARRTRTRGTRGLTVDMSKWGS